MNLAPSSTPACASASPELADHPQIGEAEQSGCDVGQHRGQRDRPDRAVEAGRGCGVRQGSARRSGSPRSARCPARARRAGCSRPRHAGCCRGSTGRASTVGRAELLAEHVERQAAAEARQDDQRAVVAKRARHALGERMVERGPLGRIAAFVDQPRDAGVAAALLQRRLPVEHLIALGADMGGRAARTGGAGRCRARGAGRCSPSRSVGMTLRALRADLGAPQAVDVERGLLDQLGQPRAAALGPAEAELGHQAARRAPAPRRSAPAPRRSAARLVVEAGDRHPALSSFIVASNWASIIAGLGAQLP